jgi:hypothetical protein
MAETPRSGSARGRPRRPAAPAAAEGSQQPGLEQIRRCLAAGGMPCAELRCGAGTVLVSAFGGRIFGPFFEGRSLSWVSPLFEDAQGFRKAVDGGAWNLGGDRIWLAPELRYNVRDRQRFLESYDLQRAVDPGAYRLEPGAHSDHCRLEQVLELQAYDGPGAKKLRLERLVRPAADPLRDVERYRQIRAQLAYSGYEQTVTLTDLEPDGRESQAWSITQVPPGGVILVPVVPGTEHQDHLEPMDEEHLELRANHLLVRAKGDRKYKIELKAAHHFGRFGYFRRLARGRAGLLVKLFFNDPSAAYVMEAPHRPGVRGYSLDIYHDDGGLGGFAEIECHGRPVGYPQGAACSSDPFLSWAYWGEEAAAREACAQLLGLGPD